MVAVLALAGVFLLSLLSLLVLLARRATRDHAALMKAVRSMERTAREASPDRDDPLRTPGT